MEKVKFGGSFAEIDDLANKVLSGEKVATSSLLIYYERNSKIKSTVGDYFSVLNSSDESVAIVRIDEVQVVKFGDITEAFAMAEGDGSLENWMTIHQSYYSKLLSRFGEKLSTETLLVCEWFRVVNGLASRPAQSNDFENICKLPQNEEDLFFMFPKADYPLSVEQLQTVVENRSDSTVILLDKEVVGFANFYEVKENDYCSIGNVIVNSNFRNKGIGSYLIKTMESIALEKYNVREIHISCFNTNTKGILLYSKLGYLSYEVEERLDKEERKVALIKMRREL